MHSSFKHDVILQTVPIVPKGPSIYAYYASMLLNGYSSQNYASIICQGLVLVILDGMPPNL